MTIETYQDLYDEAMQLFRAQQYEEALQLLTQEGQRFTDEAQVILYLRSCLAARTGRPDFAIRLIEEALDRGFWYGEQVMRETPSWQGLQGLPEFERLAEICNARQAKAKAAPRLFTQEPQQGCSTDQPCPLLIALHGNGDNARNVLNAWRPVTSDGWLLAAMQSSQAVSSDAYVWEDQDAAMRDVAEDYSTLLEQHQVNKERVIIAGFSMGGETALRASLTNIVPAKGFILLGPSGPIVNQPEPSLHLIEQSSQQGLRGYVIMGEEDIQIEQEVVRKLVEFLNAHNIPCELEIVPATRHQYPRDFAPIIARAMAFVEGTKDERRRTKDSH
jgi:predicted esterase